MAHLSHNHFALSVGVLLASTQAADVSIDIDWSKPGRTVATAATIEVDHMPFLARGVGGVKEGGNFNGYYESLQNLGASYVRFAPWYPYPRVAVAELYPPNCSAGGGGSSFNTTLLDGVMRDFMTAVCGSDAAQGSCNSGHSVVPMITTMPAWMYEGGDDRIKSVPEDPWQFPSGGFEYYVMKRAKLKDPSCRQMAKYAARILEWYTKGGTTDECGVRHESGLYYDFWGLSVLNEDEYNTPPEGGVQYTICWDAWREEFAKVNPKVVLVGPEVVSDLAYNKYFLNGSHHSDGKPPPLVANHVGFSGPPWGNFFSGVDSWINNFAVPLDDYRREVAPNADMVMNEFIPFMNEWCDGSENNGCPDWTHSSSQGTKINRKTMGWNAAAATFAYGFGRLASLGYKYVGADQLVAGPWPDNEPAVASLDWVTGEPNAKYWAVNMLAHGLGAGPKQLFNTTAKGSKAPYPAGMTRKGNCGNTAFSDKCNTETSGAWNTTEHGIKTLEDCVKKCHSCVMCNYVSFSLDMSHQDCSWYSRCDMDSLANLGGIYQSEAVSPERDTSTDVYAQGMQLQIGGNTLKKVLLVSKTEEVRSIRLADGAHAVANVLEGVGLEPGFSPPVSRSLDANGTFSLGPFGVALVTLAHDPSEVIV